MSLGEYDEKLAFAYHRLHMVVPTTFLDDHGNSEICSWGPHLIVTVTLQDPLYVLRFRESLEPILGDQDIELYKGVD